MQKKIIIDANFPSETRVVLLDKNNNIENIEFSSSNKKQIKGNIYLAKITRIEPSLQAAFVDYGEDKSGFLPFSEIHPDYYHIPSTDKKADAFAGREINSPQITPEDLAEKQKNNTFHELIDSDEIDINAIAKMVDDKLQSNIDIEADENDIDPISKAPSNNEKRYKIQEVLKKGQILLIQATKEERGNKGASLTSYISLAGKYCVLMPNKPSHNGISRKISNHDERKRLKKIISDLTASNEHNMSSVIARTAGAGHTTLEIKRDYDYLAKLWNKIREATLKSKAPCFIHQEDGILLQTIRDMFDRNVKEIIVQGSQAYNSCVKFMGDILPGEIKAVKEYKSKTPIYTKFGIEDQLIKLYQPIAHLPSGGYIVINPTEALISIDVNSGKSTGERSIEDMALKTNLEAAREVARQARLRDLSGLLVIDFIDLSENKNRKILERSLWEYFSKDKARIQTSQISTFGLLEMSRQRLRPSFLEMNSNMCSHCSGKGVVRADESNAMLILRTVENEIFNGKFNAVNVYGVGSSIIYLLNDKRAEIEFIEKKHNIKLNFFIDRDATSDSYSIEKIRVADANKAAPTFAGPALQDTSDIYNESEPETNHKPQKRRIDKPQQKNFNENKAPKEADKPTTIVENKETTEAPQEIKAKRPARNRKRITKKTAPNKEPSKDLNQEPTKPTDTKK
ncbi:MAG: Rne/Rng family ribonuclease [Rickettsiaceae bacterium]|nr:Rne/Rng family ribonuclease [Rickettsiaceae bacterium]MDP4832815.1 Rne/Rng family ribonuclease [Rickettsiaceae bacterium]MDP5020470.1 Rne/Rng family ribonuclease [Rickettsiaceae bacterium]MDP5083158.1 Rne/Rng family ribonuclease [Rickettsiaceae bacterium]